MSGKADGLVFGHKWDMGGDDPIADIEALIQHIHRPMHHQPHVELLNQCQIRRLLLLMIRADAITVEQAHESLDSFGLATPIYGPHEKGDDDGRSDT